MLPQRRHRRRLPPLALRTHRLDLVPGHPAVVRKIDALPGRCRQHYGPVARARHGVPVVIGCARRLHFEPAVPGTPALNIKPATVVTAHPRQNGRPICGTCQARPLQIRVARGALFDPILAAICRREETPPHSRLQGIWPRCLGHNREWVPCRPGQHHLPVARGGHGAPEEVRVARGSSLSPRPPCIRRGVEAAIIVAHDQRGTVARSGHTVPRSIHGPGWLPLRRDILHRQRR